MSFKKGYDPRRYTGGRSFVHNGKDPKEKTVKEMGYDQLMQLFRKVKPHTKKAVQVAARLMEAEDVSHATQLKAAMFLVNEYKTLIKEGMIQQDVYDQEDDEEQEDDRPLVRLHVARDNTEEKEG